MTELSGFGVPSWLPPSVQRAQAIEAQREARQQREVDNVLASRREQWEQDARVACRSACEAKGEVVYALSLATGEGLGRTVAEVFADALAQSDAEDARDGGPPAHRPRSVPRLQP